MAETILLVGATGYLGHYVSAELRRRGLRFVSAGRRGCDVALDLADPDSIRAALAAVRPDAIVTVAAMSRIDECERDPRAARAVNAHGARVLAEHGVRTLYVSTDLVFDGASAPYRSSDPPSPISAYGRSKAEGEAAVRELGGLVVRLPVLFGPSHSGRQGATDMVRAALREGRELRMYENEHRTPMHAADAATAAVDLLLERDRVGVVHARGPERVSRYELVLRFCRVHGLPQDFVHPARSTDPLRPRDVSMIGEWEAPRSLDEALAAS